MEFIKCIREIINYNLLMSYNVYVIVIYVRKEYRKYGKSPTVTWLLQHIATHIFMRQPHIYNAVQVWSYTHTNDHTQQYANIIPPTHTQRVISNSNVNILSSVFLDFLDFSNIFLCLPDDCYIKWHEKRLA